MADSIDEIRKETNELTSAMRRLNETTGGAIRAFGEFGSATGKIGRAWTILSRVTSGSGFWEIQNRIRSVSNAFELITTATDAQREKTMKSLEANFELSKSYKKLVEEKKNIEGTALYQMLLEDTNATIANKYATEEYTRILKKMDNAMEKRRKGIRKQFKLDKSSLQLLKDRVKEEGVLAEILRPTKALGTRMGKMIPGIKDALLGKEGTGTTVVRNAFGEPTLGSFQGRRGFGAQMVKGGANIVEKFGSFLKYGLIYFSAFLVLGATLSLIFGLLFLFFRKTLPTLKKFFVDAFSNFKKAFSAILKVVVGVFSLFKALFEGRFIDAIKILFKDIIKNLLIAVGNIIGGLLKLALGAIASAIVGLGRTIKAMFLGTLKRLPFIGKRIRNPAPEEIPIPKPIKAFAKGGITGNGYSLVGEQGPELVRLPIGSRVFSNAESNRMAGGTTNITVQVTGRVGASDMEIKDIARKVSREIGLQMNRTGSTAVRF